MCICMCICICICICVCIYIYIYIVYPGAHARGSSMPCRSELELSAGAGELAGELEDLHN